MRISTAQYVKQQPNTAITLTLSALYRYMGFTTKIRSKKDVEKLRLIIEVGLEKTLT